LAKVGRGAKRPRVFESSGGRLRQERMSPVRKLAALDVDQLPVLDGEPRREACTEETEVMMGRALFEVSPVDGAWVVRMPSVSVSSELKATKAKAIQRA
jgi:hypothetical protein